MLVLVHGDLQLFKTDLAVVVGVNGLEVFDDIGGYFFLNQIGAYVGEES